MRREDVLLAVLAASNGRSYTPVQIQKALFLISENIPTAISQGQGYNFRAYDYGPFDAAVYHDAEAMARNGLAEIVQGPNSRWKTYAASDRGLAQGSRVLNGLDDAHRAYVCEVSEWVRNQTFEQLVKSIYNAYPDMRANSIFNG